MDYRYTSSKQCRNCGTLDGPRYRLPLMLTAKGTPEELPYAERDTHPWQCLVCAMAEGHAGKTISRFTGEEGSGKR